MSNFENKLKKVKQVQEQKGMECFKEEKRCIGIFCDLYPKVLDQRSEESKELEWLKIAFSIQLPQTLLSHRSIHSNKKKILERELVKKGLSQEDAENTLNGFINALGIVVKGSGKQRKVSGSTKKSGTSKGKQGKSPIRSVLVVLIALVAIIGWVYKNSKEREVPSIDAAANSMENSNINTELETEEEYHSNEITESEERITSVDDLKLERAVDLEYEKAPVGNGRVYELMGEYSEARNIAYVSEIKNSKNLISVGKESSKITVIEGKVYFVSRRGNEASGYGTAFSADLNGENETIIGYQIPLDQPVFIMNNAIYTQNRKITLGKPESEEKLSFVKQFLTFDSDYAYFIDNENRICRSDYSFEEPEELNWGISGDRIEWAEIFQSYFVYYDKVDEKCYGYSIDTGKTIEYPVQTLTDNTGNTGNYKWIYGIVDNSIVRVSLDGKEKKTLCTIEAEKIGLIHVTSNIIFFYVEDEGRKEYTFDLRTGQCNKIYSD